MYTKIAWEIATFYFCINYQSTCTSNSVDKATVQLICFPNETTKASYITSSDDYLSVIHPVPLTINTSDNFDTRVLLISKTLIAILQKPHRIVLYSIFLRLHWFMAKFQTKITLAIELWTKSDKVFPEYGYINNI